MDPLSDVLSILKPKQYGAGALDFGGNWSLTVPHHRGFKCYAVTQGECWLEVEGEPEPLCLREGDCLLLARGHPFQFGARPGLRPTPLSDLPARSEDGVTKVNGGGACLLIGGHFRIEEDHASLLRNLLPSAVVARGQPEQAALRWALEEIRRELGRAQPGVDLVIEHLIHLILLHCLRLYLVDGTPKMRGWLGALSDPKIARALGAIHADPSKRWSLQALANEAGMSRTSFTERFSALVGQSPISYLTRWRMQLAAVRMRSGGQSLADVGRSVGYDSLSAFSAAFKRETGLTPRAYQTTAPSQRDVLQ